jgi:hypothetical protein
MKNIKKPSRLFKKKFSEKTNNPPLEQDISQKYFPEEKKPSYSETFHKTIFQKKVQKLL